MGGDELGVAPIIGHSDVEFCKLDKINESTFRASPRIVTCA